MNILSKKTKISVYVFYSFRLSSYKFLSTCVTCSSRANLGGEALGLMHSNGHIQFSGTFVIINVTYSSLCIDICGVYTWMHIYMLIILIYIHYNEIETHKLVNRSRGLNLDSLDRCIEVPASYPVGYENLTESEMARRTGCNELAACIGCGPAGCCQTASAACKQSDLAHPDGIQRMASLNRAVSKRSLLYTRLENTLIGNTCQHVPPSCLSHIRESTVD